MNATTAHTAAAIMALTSWHNTSCQTALLTAYTLTVVATSSAIFDSLNNFEPP